MANEVKNHTQVNDDLPIKSFLHNKWVRTVLILDAIVLVGLAGFVIYQSTKTSTIAFNVTPTDATISLNGRSGYSNDQYSISAGTYKISVSHDNMQPKTITLDIDSKSHSTINIFLKGNDGGFGFYEQKNNYESYQKLESIASKDHNITSDSDASAQDFIAKYSHVMSLYSKLPIIGFTHANLSVNTSTGGYTIKNGRDRKECEVIACLLVLYHGIGYEEEVSKELKALGYNQKDYQIIYERYN